MDKRLRALPSEAAGGRAADKLVLALTLPSTLPGHTCVFTWEESISAGRGDAFRFCGTEATPARTRRSGRCVWALRGSVRDSCVRGHGTARACAGLREAVLWALHVPTTWLRHVRAPRRDPAAGTRLSHMWSLCRSATCGSGRK